MRVLHYLSRFRSQDGGVPRSVLDLCAALARAGHDVTLATGGDEMVPREWMAAASGAGPSALMPRVLALRPWRALRRLGAAERGAIDAVLRTCDIAHLHVPWDAVGVQVGRRAAALGTPYLVTAHGMLDDWTMAHRPLRKRLFLGLGGERFLAAAAAVQCTSSVEAEQSRRWFRGGRTAIAPLLTDLAPFAEEASMPPRAEREADEPLEIVFLGRLDPIKGVEDLIAAVAELRAAGRSCAASIAGSGEEGYARSLVALARRLGVGDRVRFLGHVGGDAKIALLRSADVCVLPSRHENFGVALIESLAAATPVVTTRGVNIWRELEASGGAVIVGPADRGRTDALAKELARALADHAAQPGRLREMGRRGRAWVLRELAPAAVVARYEAIYADLGRRPRD